MCRNASLLAIVLLFTASHAGNLRAQGVDGTWKLTFLGNNGTVEYTDFIVSLKTVDGAITGKLTEEERGRRVSVAQEGDSICIQVGHGSFGGFPVSQDSQDFQAPIPKEPAKRWLGSYTRGKAVYPAWLSVISETTATTVGRPELMFQGESRTHVCPPLQDAVALKKKALRLSYGKGEAAKKQADEAADIAKKETPGLYRKVLKRFPNAPAVFEAVLGLMRSAQENKATLEEVKGWSALADKAARAYGPRLETAFAVQASAALQGQGAYAAVALDYARRVERTLTPKTLAQEQIDVLEPLGRALRQAGQGEEAGRVEGLVATLEDELDRKYLATLPAVQPYAGRKSKSKRAVILEQFTDHITGDDNSTERACSMLLKTYKPSELIVVQYCLYSSFGGERGAVLAAGPLCNPDVRARFDYFNKAFPVEVRGASVSLFNGLPKRRRDRGRDVASIYKGYGEIIEPLLEENASVTLGAKAVRSGDKIDIQVTVSGLANPDTDMKLRIVLAEEAIRYPGRPDFRPNGTIEGVRIHHNVVRGCPGGLAGIPLTEADSKHNVSLSLTELRGQLAKYLENAKVKDPAPLLRLANLRVIAFVQDDLTREILQAVQVDVK